MPSTLGHIKAMAFDTGGTILDWHGGLSRAIAAASASAGLTADWTAVTNDYRRRSLGAIVNQLGPRFNFDDVHRDQLDRVLEAHGLGAIGKSARDEIWRAWFKLDAWPDFPAALERLRTRYPVVSFTLLTLALVVAVSRRNAIVWDGIISCEMIGVYKVRPEAYQTAAKLLQLKPEEILMVACHNFDLDAARGQGFKTCFVRRPLEWGPPGPPDPNPNPGCDLVVDTFEELARISGC
ncbi:MAG TPA: haloacid dehalogenase type II [Hyphomicrobiaceae bacterium]|nr:haloacid dehalogenase type II [Hyphomicrobiaceae bacterium]